jgi:Mrp family chromosome partitioning ATPase
MEPRSGAEADSGGGERGAARQPSESAIYGALARVEHPEVKGHNLVELGMIPEVRTEGERGHVTLALPYANVPIRDELVRRVHQAVQHLVPGLSVEVEVVEMDEGQRAAFLEVSRRYREAASRRRRVRHVLAVMSGKGGVGKSSVAGLLARALRRRGLKVGVLDADITGPSIPKLFGVRDVPEGAEGGVVPPESATGIKLMSINLMLQSEDQPVVWRGPLVSRAIQQFWDQVVWGDLDYLVVDLPPGTSDAALTVMQSLPLDGIILVTTPQDLAGMVVRKAANMAKHLDVPLLGLVENMSYIDCPECGARIEAFGPSRAEDTARHARINLLGRIPLDPRLAVMCDAGNIEEYPDAGLETAVEAILNLTAKQAKPGESG